MAGLQADDAILAGLGESEHDRVVAEKQHYAVEGKRSHSDHSTYEAEEHNLGPDYPTEEQKATLRRVPDTVNAAAYLM